MWTCSIRKKSFYVTIALIALFVVSLAAPASVDYQGNIPDDSRIVFTAKRPAKFAEGKMVYQIFSMRTDGSDLIQLTDNDLDDCDPHWAGGRIVFERGDWSSDTPGWEIWIMDADGSNEELIATTPEGATHCYNPRISPDGKQMIYSVYWEGSASTVHLVDLESGDSRQLNMPTGAKWSIYWHPDGDSLVFSIGADIYGGGAGYSLVRYNIVNGDLTEYLGAEGDLQRWSAQVSPDGTRLVFHQNYEGSTYGQREIMVSNLADGSIAGPLARTDESENDPRPTWSPDGESIYFKNSIIDGESSRTSIFMMSADGSGEAVELAGLPESAYVGVPNICEVIYDSGTYEPESLSVIIDEISRSNNVVDLKAVAMGAVEPLEATWNVGNVKQKVETCDSTLNLACGEYLFDGRAALTSIGMDATVEFMSPGICEVTVTVVDAAGAKGTAKITVANTGD